MDINQFIQKTLEGAAAELKSRFGTRLHISDKEDTSIVTDADLAAEKIILDQIRQNFPQDKIFSEESGLSSTDRTPGSFIWVIDPLDGTTNFSNAYPFFCVSIARGEFDANGKIVIKNAGIADPSRDSYYLAERGQGAYRDGQRVQMSQSRPFHKSFLVTGFYYHLGDTLGREIERFSRIAARCQSIRRDGAAALDLAFVGGGIYDGFWEIGLQPWDVAAGSLIVEEAGGVVHNYPSAEGSPENYDIEGVGIIAGNASVVTEIAKELSS